MVVKRHAKTELSTRMKHEEHEQDEQGAQAARGRKETAEA